MVREKGEMLMDKLDILLERIDEALKSGSKEEILKLNSDYNDKLKELAICFSDIATVKNTGA